jgi:hypothetical protein
LTVTLGAATLVPSSGLDSTKGGVIGVAEGGASSSSASCSIKAEKRICRPAVPFRDATLPARVVMSYLTGEAGEALTEEPRTAARMVAAAMILESFMGDYPFPKTMIVVLIYSWRFRSARAHLACRPGTTSLVDEMAASRPSSHKPENHRP